MSDLEGSRPHIPRGQVRGMSGTAEEVGHRVVGGVALGAGGVIGPAYGVTVGLEPRALVAGKELGDGSVVGPCKQLFGWVNWRGSGHEHLVGCLRPNALLNYPASEEASGLYYLGALFQPTAKDEGGGVEVVTSNSQASENAMVRGLESSPEVAGVGWR